MNRPVHGSGGPRGSGPLHVSGRRACSAAQRVRLGPSKACRARRGIVFSSHRCMIGVKPRRPTARKIVHFHISLRNRAVGGLSTGYKCVRHKVRGVGRDLACPRALTLASQLSCLKTRRGHRTLYVYVRGTVNVRIDRHIGCVHAVVSRLRHVSSRLLFCSYLTVSLNTLATFFCKFHSHRVVLSVFRRAYNKHLVVGCGAVKNMRTSLRPGFVPEMGGFVPCLHKVVRRCRSMFANGIVTQRHLGNMKILDHRSTVSFKYANKANHTDN